MQPTTLALLIGLLIVTAGGLLLWLVRSLRRPNVARTEFVNTRPVFADTVSSGGGAEPQETAPDDAGPDTVLSYLDVPTNSGFASRFASTSPSLFPEDFETSTQPQAFTPSLPPNEATNPDERQRIARAVQALGDGPADRAWQTLQGFMPEPGNRPGGAGDHGSHCPGLRA
ncbi:MAG: hypothetical protein QM742_13960 [Aquabacterium sp.]